MGLSSIDKVAEDVDHEVGVASTVVPIDQDEDEQVSELDIIVGDEVLPAVSRPPQHQGSVLDLLVALAECLHHLDSDLPLRSAPWPLQCHQWTKLLGMVLHKIGWELLHMSMTENYSY